MAEQPPKSFSNDQSSYLARVLRAIEIKLNNVAATIQSLGQSNIGPDVAGTGPVLIADQGANTIPASTFVLANWTEVTDTNNCFNGTRFTPNVAGYYQVNANAIFNVIAQNFIMLMKNSTGAGTGRYIDGSNGNTTFITGLSGLVFMNGTTDYLEIYLFSPLANSTTASGAGYHFSAFLARAA